MKAIVSEKTEDLVEKGSCSKKLKEMKEGHVDFLLFWRSHIYKHTQYK